MSEISEKGTQLINQFAGALLFSTFGIEPSGDEQENLESYIAALEAENAELREGRAPYDTYMSDDYQKRLLAHSEAVSAVTWDLLVVAKQLCPGDWVLQIEPNLDTETQKRVYLAVVHNGDDNVTGTGITIAAALADLINYLLHGSVFPLAGNGGQYVHPADRGWVKEEKGS